MCAKLLLASVAIVLLATASAEYDVAKYCQLVKTGTKLPSMTSCKTFYICGPNNLALQGNCDANSVFDKDLQTCVPESQGNCYFGLTNPCENKDKQFAPNPKACNQWHYCENGQIAGSGSCVAGQIFSASNGTCMYGKCNSDNNGPADVQNLCDIMPNGEFFGDFKNCNAWHRCNQGTQQNSNCLDNLVFDAKNGMCLKNDGTMCDRTGGNSAAGGPPADSTCTKDAAVKTVADTLLCSVYYVCQEVPTDSNPPTPLSYKWVETRCNKQYFDVIDKTCRDRTIARAYPDCNRCEFTTGSTHWVNRNDTTCSGYSTCRNGQKLSGGDNKCGSGSYFNEALQYCVGGSPQSYSANNGACQGYTCTDDRVCTLNPPAPETPGSPGPSNPDTQKPSDPSKPDTSVPSDPSNSDTQKPSDPSNTKTQTPSAPPKPETPKV